MSSRLIILRVYLEYDVAARTLCQLVRYFFTDHFVLIRLRLAQPILIMETVGVRNLCGFDGGDRIDKGGRPKFCLTCAVEFPILFPIVDDFTGLKHDAAIVIRTATFELPHE